METNSLQHFMNDINRGVYNFTNEGKCSCCGECCSNILPLSKDEIQKIKKYVRKHHIQDTTKRDNVQFNMVCPFRDNEKKICTIYAVRPLICSDFKCDKMPNKIKATLDFMYETRRTTFVREEFFGGK